MITLKSTLIRLNSSVWSLALPVAADQIRALLEDNEEKRVICEINSSLRWHAALMPDGKGDYFINVSKDVRKRGGIEEGDELTISLSKDTSEYGLPLPPELAELWAMDPAAKAVFHTLSRGKQRSLLFIIGKPKGSATRAKKAVQVMEYLKSTDGVLDFRELNQAMKDGNRR